MPRHILDILHVVVCASLLLSCSTLVTRIDTNVEQSQPEEKQCGHLVVESAEEPPYQRRESIELNDEELEEHIRNDVREYLTDRGRPFTEADVEKGVEFSLNVLEQYIHGILFLARFDSFKDGNRPRVPCPRFVQLANYTFTAQDSAGKTLETEKGATHHSWVRDGGKPTASGWFVDKYALGTNPVYTARTTPIQVWSMGRTSMGDVPGILDLATKNRLPGTVLAMTIEFQTWLLAPCSQAGHIDVGLVSGLAEIESGSHTDDHRPQEDEVLLCESQIASIPKALRIPVGYVQWGFTVTVTLDGAGNPEPAVISNSNYTWLEGSAASRSIYDELMSGNYPDWSVP